MSILNFVTFNTVNKQKLCGVLNTFKKGVRRYPQSKTLRTADLADSPPTPWWEPLLRI